MIVSATAGDRQHCTASQLTARLDGANGGAGHNLETVAVTNVSASACRISGYPKIVFFDEHGRAVAGQSPQHVVDPRYDEHGPQTILIGPRGQAAIQILVDDAVLPTQCAPAAEADAILPPNASDTKSNGVKVLWLGGADPQVPVLPCAVVSVSAWQPGDGRYFDRPSAATSPSP